MIYTISKQFTFDAAHSLSCVPKEHKCYGMHGHTYRVELICSGEADERGFVCDYSEIADVWKPIHEQIDHKVLNDIPGLENPTTEVLAVWILNKVQGIPLYKVRVYESSTTWCEVSK